MPSASYNGRRSTSTTRASGSSASKPRAALGRIFHRHERAALDTDIAGHENALAYGRERVDHGEEQLGLALENREVRLAENGATTLALLNDVRERQASERDELRDQLVARAHGRPGLSCRP